MSEKISAMPAASLPLAGTELVPIVQGGANVSAPASALGLVPKELTPVPLAAGSNPYAFTLAHGLGRNPIFFQFYLICTTADAGLNCAAGQRVSLNPYWFLPSGHPAISMWSDATNVYLATGNAWDVISNTLMPLGGSVAFSLSQVTSMANFSLGVSVV